MITPREKIIQRANAGVKSVSVLIDPDKADLQYLKVLLPLAETSGVDFILVGGSFLHQGVTENTVLQVKSLTKLPVIIFPGSAMQAVSGADAIFFLSLISGRNPDYLIGQHVMAAPRLKLTGLEVIPTGYLLVNGGPATTAQYISQTMPLPSDKPEIAAATALAGEYLGLKMMYLDTGSGATQSVHSNIIRAVRSAVSVPVWVGGGIKSPEDVVSVLDAGADGIVVGTAIENNPNVLPLLIKAARSLEQSHP